MASRLGSALPSHVRGRRAFNLHSAGFDAACSSPQSQSYRPCRGHRSPALSHSLSPSSLRLDETSISGAARKAGAASAAPAAPGAAPYKYARIPPARIRASSHSCVFAEREDEKRLMRCCTGRRAGWGLVKSWRGVCPKLRICASAAARRAGSARKSRSAPPSYVR